MRPLLLSLLVVLIQFMAVSAVGTLTCLNRPSPCFHRVVKCPKECPDPKPRNPKAKACYLDCKSPKCEAVCRGRKPSCNGIGAGCYDPRFIGGDGIVFYFHGRKDESFALVSDPRLQINARFIGLRPEGRTRDFTWIQALGVLFESHAFTVEAIKAKEWDDAVDHFKFSYDEQYFFVPEGHLSVWKSPDNKLTVERTASRNSVMITIDGIAEVALNAVPVDKEDDKIHKYQIPSDDSFAHLEAQFRFSGLSPNVEGVLGQTYQPNFENRAKPGVAMPVVGGEDKYQTSSLLSPNCKLCLFGAVEEN
ncbi:hypothetical protein HPP92_013628 [Vanilla planifolia]|uniref:Uncharacterized protein n=1 Tax=Vanilla planifolia TaxID=51239 RepID=A0A835QUE4_VANPL|nr:hypothetical protein HPP92_014065 [Vanilla planifolia]KAG0478909.1 hypothetical protein HPP92_013628 [Vanilla planifolia]